MLPLQLATQVWSLTWPGRSPTQWHRRPSLIWMQQQGPFTMALAVSQQDELTLFDTMCESRFKLQTLPCMAGVWQIDYMCVKSCPQQSFDEFCGGIYSQSKLIKWLGWSSQREAHQQMPWLWQSLARSLVEAMRPHNLRRLFKGLFSCTIAQTACRLPWLVHNQLHASLHAAHETLGPGMSQLICNHMTARMCLTSSWPALAGMSAEFRSEMPFNT